MNVPPSKIADGWLKKFLLAGCAYFTVRSLRTDKRFTFRIEQPEEIRNQISPPHFVGVLAGPDNTRNYEYLGTIFNRTSYKHGRRSKVREDAPSAIAARWVVTRVLSGEPLKDCEVWHEGRCGRCGRMLTVPESIESGFGPECIKKV